MTKLRLLLIICLLCLASAFSPRSRAIARQSYLHSTSVLFSNARDLLYDDQQRALERRALVEEELLNAKQPKELKAPKIKARAKAGTGFGGKQDPKTWLAREQAKIIEKEGVIRINQVLSADLADRLRRHILEQQQVAASRTQEDPSISRTFYGVENQRKNRCDLQLSLLQGGYAADNGGVVDKSEPHVVAEALQELLGKDGSLRMLYENLVTLQGEFYELAALVTQPGSIRQTVHPDLPFKEKAPLYVVFIALQDVTLAMGPTCFLLRTHTKKENDKFYDQDQKDGQLSTADSRMSTLQKGDAAVFDARILHCGTANDVIEGSTRVLFNFSFRNPQVTGSLGYPGSIRPGYCERMTLQDMQNALQHFEDGDQNPFATYSDGISTK